MPATRRTDLYRSRTFPIRTRAFDQYVKLHTSAPIDPGIAVTNTSSVTK
ncbi:MAG: hypothetical protein WBY93_09455 [Candidatus Binatus sp.]